MPKITLAEFTEEADKLTGMLTTLVVNNIPQRGNTSEECQRIALINAINQLEHCINGVTEEDL
jgi:hypothetical protein